MSLAQDIAAFNLRLDTALKETMEYDVFNEARDAILAHVFDDVYDKYTSHAKDPYERRYTEGGLADTSNIVLTASGPTGDGWEITVEDLAPDQDGLPVAEIIESGEGYHWENSEIYQKEPYPRPFHKKAEKDVYQTGAFAAGLKRGLRGHGFTVD